MLVVALYLLGNFILFQRDSIIILHRRNKLSKPTEVVFHMSNDWFSIKRIPRIIVELDPSSSHWGPTSELDHHFLFSTPLLTRGTLSVRANAQLSVL